MAPVKDLVVDHVFADLLGSPLYVFQGDQVVVFGGKKGHWDLSDVLKRDHLGFAMFCYVPVLHENLKPILNVVLQVVEIGLHACPSSLVLQIPLEAVSIVAVLIGQQVSGAIFGEKPTESIDFLCKPVDSWHLLDAEHC